MGAMQGWGRLTVALMSALPTVLAGKRGGADVGDGGRSGGADGLAADDGVELRDRVVPCGVSGTGAWSARTTPRIGLAVRV